MQTGTILPVYLVFLATGSLPLLVGIVSIVERITFVVTFTGVKPLKGRSAVTIGVLYLLLGLPSILILAIGTLIFDASAAQQTIVGVFSLLLLWLLAGFAINFVGFQILKSKD